ncbi:CRISPR-associated protein Cas4 [Pararhodospirillum oryzae]|nr:CRISPR-associated protein Cas4 [Pararhodospirillum oryzae]
MVPIAALQHAVYCLRQAALIHLEQAWAENRFTAEGHQLHITVDIPDARARRGVRRVTALPLVSMRLGLEGVADVVEFHRAPAGSTPAGSAPAGSETPYPVEIKRGKPKPHAADTVQLCAQALCLEEMTGLPVPEGAVYYGETRHRLPVAFTPELRALTLDTLRALRRLFETQATPPAPSRTGRCRACSLIELCRPKAGATSALAWRARTLAARLDSPDGDDETPP